MIEARTRAARAEYKGLLWGKGSSHLSSVSPHSLGVHTEERTEEKEGQQQRNFQVLPRIPMRTGKEME